MQLVVEHASICSVPLAQTISELEHFATAKGYPVIRDGTGQALGSFNRLTKRITLRADLPPLQQAKTLVHELAHALLHGNGEAGEKRHLLELEAESCAFVVCSSLGLDTSAYSFAYLAGWAEDPSELLPAGQRACQAADDILGALGAPLSLAA